MIDRYNESPVGCIEDEYGEYVKHSDYAKLEAENQKLRDAISGKWEGYAWKDGEYIDDLETYFETVTLASSHDSPEKP